ncbi:MAG TPA: sigma-70 family RNA polymerase sigma factor [Gemmatimonadales bacterium]|jgi:RNA polymerase sigma-70 factor (ECF subfamily)
MPPFPEPSDRALMHDVQRGDLAALDMLFARHHRRLYSFLARLTGDPDAADDLVQDAFLRLLRFKASFRADGEFIPWLFRIARNLAVDRYHGAEPTSASASDALVAESDGALDVLLRDERQHQLEQALATLPLAQREVLLLHGTEHLSHRDLGAVLGCTEGAARVRVHRALAALRGAWHATTGEPR